MTWVRGQTGSEPRLDTESETGAPFKAKAKGKARLQSTPAWQCLLSFLIYKQGDFCRTTQHRFYAFTPDRIKPAPSKAAKDSHWDSEWLSGADVALQLYNYKLLKRPPQTGAYVSLRFNPSTYILGWLKLWRHFHRTKQMILCWHFYWNPAIKALRLWLVSFLLPCRTNLLNRKGPTAHAVLSLHCGLTVKGVEVWVRHMAYEIG